MACLKNDSKQDVTDRNLLGGKALKLVAGAFYIPKERNSSNNEGDDAHFICLEKQTIGVADGVGGWHAKGVDPGKFARNLMSNTVNALEKQPKGDLPLRQVLNEAFSETNDEGSSTACIISLGDKCVHVINVGDSGFMVIRKGTEELYKSPIQTRSFNHPFQLGKSLHCDAPNVAEMFDVKVKSGDVIIAGTDGLFDNMFVEQISDVAKVGIEEGKDPAQVAWIIAEHAHYNSIDRDAYTSTPFTKAAFEAGRERYGGKYDDITVIVAYITDD